MTRQFHIPATLLLVVCILAVTSPVLGQYDGFPVCEMTDSSMTVASSLDDILHPFGQDTVTYPNEFSLVTSYPVFNKVFEFYLSPSVSSRWSSSEFQTLIASILDNDSTVTDDVFGIDWNYFLRSGADANSYHAGVRFTVFGSTYTKIKLRLYSMADLPSPCSGPGYGNACKGYSFYGLGNVLTINASASNPMSTVLGLGIGHELQHLIYNANGFPAPMYESANETLSTLAEYLLDAWRDPNIYDLPYDSSIIREEPCDSDSKYQTEKMWIIYLYELFKGNPSDITDDLIYRWINSTVSASTRMRLSGLATELWHSDFAWVGGTDATDRLSKVFANFLVAKFGNAPELGSQGEFGIGALNTVNDFGLFLDICDWKADDAIPWEPVDCPENAPCLSCSPCPADLHPDCQPACPSCPPSSITHQGCWNVRVLVPEYTLSASAENALTLVSGLYEDGDASGVTGDNSTDYIDVAMYGTDYVIFRAGTYYQDDAEHELEIRVSGSAEKQIPPYPSTSSAKPIGWVIGYSSNDATLQTHPEHIVFIEPLTFSPATTGNTSVTTRPVIVTDFGRSIKAVVLAIGITAVSPTAAVYASTNRFFYEYEYGVFTPDTGTRTWAGDVYATGDVTIPEDGTLDIDPGTRVKMWPSDLAEEGNDTDKIELNVLGELIADGTQASPIVFESWKPETTEDWLGFYFDDESDGGTFDHCDVSRAEYAIESFVPLTVTNTTIEDCKYVSILSQAGGALIQGCTLNDPGSFGIFLTTDSTVVRNTVVNNAVGTALNVQLNAAARVRNSQFLNSSWGLFHRGTSHAADIDSSCTFVGNEIGVYFFETLAGSYIKRCAVEGNTTGILCDNASPTVSFNTMKENVVGVECIDASPLIASNEIKMGDIGVLTSGTSQADIGHYPSSGNNKIAHNDYYQVFNDGSYTIYAQNNCWGHTSSPCAASQGEIYGAVNVLNAWCCSVSQSFMFTLPEGSKLPTKTEIGSIVPNPFNPTTSIRYEIAATSDVEIRVYDVAGRFVRDLVQEAKAPGSYSVAWDGVDRRGQGVASGVYFVRMVANGQYFTKKMVLLK